MNAKERDVVFRRWSGVIGRESRDLTSLEQISRRALADNDVRDDPTLQRMIQDALQQRRIELKQHLHDKEASTSSAEARPALPSDVPEAPPTRTSEEARTAFKRLAYALGASLERADEQDTLAILAKLKAIQEQHPEVIAATSIDEFKERVAKFSIHVQQLTDEISEMTQKAVLAAREGNEEDLTRSLRRLTAIHAAHPRFLDEPRLEEIRDDVADAADERLQHRRTARELLERERAIAAEIKTLATAVRGFHEAACTLPDTSDEFQQAEAAYLRTIQRVRTYDTEWFSGVILELADLLAEWTIPPLGAEGQIDRFLDSISRGLTEIRREMGKIEDKRALDDNNRDASAGRQG